VTSQLALGLVLSKGLIDNGGFSEGKLRGIDRETALVFRPRLKT
jgi:hypothetical protein